LTLLDENTFTATTPQSSSVNNYEFEIRRNHGNNPTWFPFHQGPEKSFTKTARTAGEFKVRASMTVNNTKVYSNEVALEVQFPQLDDFKNNPQLQSAFYAMWLSTLNATTNGGRREEGCYITLDTATGIYATTPSFEGPKVPNNIGAEIPAWWFIQNHPADIFANSNSPTSTAVYVVGFFHTHTPTLWTTQGRLVGPSQADYTFARETIGLPGLVYDYTGGWIPAGHPINEPATLYPITPPERR
jgi:hypothetical protein